MLDETQSMASELSHVLASIAQTRRAIDVLKKTIDGQHKPRLGIYLDQRQTDLVQDLARAKFLITQLRRKEREAVYV